MKGKSLGEARALFRARKFTDVIRILEPNVFQYRESLEYFRLLGFSCLQAGDFGGAFSYISRAWQLKDDDVNVILGLAAIHFRRAENESALKRWLEAIEIQPTNPIARRGLDLLRKGMTADALQTFIDSGKIKTLYPPLARRTHRGTILIVLLCVVALAGVAYAAYRLTEPRTASDRPGVSVIEIPSGLSSLVDVGTSYTYMLSEREVQQLFAKIKKDLLSYRDNLAAMDANRILLSNAAPAIRERARLLKGFVTPAGFDTLRDAAAYTTVRTQPGLYDACSVQWRGKIANLKITKDAIDFDLLVGYDQEKELQGIVPVTLPFAVDLANGGSLEVLGQVVSKTGSDISLLGIAVHKLAAQ
jgi:hypothetical protein